MSAIDTILELEQKRYAMRYAAAQSEFLLQTTDPVLAAAGRSRAAVVFELITRDVLCGDCLQEALCAYNKCPDDNFWHNALVKELERERKETLGIDPSLLAEKTRLASDAFGVWIEAKKSGEWELFAPYLQKALDLTKRIQTSLSPHQDPYETCLQKFEPESSTAMYDALFDTLKTQLLPLVDQVLKAPYPETSVVSGTFEVEKQRALAYKLLELETVNLDALVLSESEHPFTLACNPNHVYITEHIYPESLSSNIFTVLHEGGHALYQQNISEEAAYTSLDDGSSMGMDESQSRFFENYIGRSWAFMEPLLGMLRHIWPERFSATRPEELYQALNVVQKENFIRCDADELTYPFHVAVRYEIEKALFDGSLSVKDVPNRWNELMRDYLHVDVPNNTVGCLQDIHWTACEFGYFPTYVLGSVYGAQILEAMQKDLDFYALVAKGNLLPIATWLREKIWQWGKSKTTEEILRNACGSTGDALPFCAYLKEKYESLYLM